jgi:two-component system, NtrC family, nitrogen regulation sensor histidine kinase NtrY
MKRGPAPLSFDRRLLLLALWTGLPAVAATVALLLALDVSPKVFWTTALLVGGVWLGGALALHERVVRLLQTVANLLAALREGDFSVRGRGAAPGDPLGELLLEVNQLAGTLRAQRLDALEASALLRRVMEVIDVAVFAFDGADRAVLANRAAERLIGGPAALLPGRPDDPGALVGRTAADLGLSDCLGGEAPRTVSLQRDGAGGPFELRRSAFRLGGLPHTLIVLTDVGRALREEERQAWQRLVRVLGHEINNSLAPIHSIAQGLQEDVSSAQAGGRALQPGDLSDGLLVISRRAESLMRFMKSYARLARLPRSQPGPLEVGPWVQRIAALERRVAVAVAPGPPLSIAADADQLDQLLINLVSNGADAALETGGGVSIGWSASATEVEVQVRDEGPGLAATANLFVPFFTTKPQGSGIGLALSRQIAEQHGGRLTLENRRDRQGCVATLVLPR